MTAQAGPVNEISMTFDLNTTIPAGIPTWFIARPHRFTTNNHWRYGAILADNRDRPSHLALVRAFPQARYVQLTVRGPYPHNFFALLRDGLEVTLGRFPGLNIGRSMPCPGHDGNQCNYRFDYERLQKAVERDTPVLEIECQETFEKVPGLLFGLHWRADELVIARLNEVKTRVVKESNRNARRAPARDPGASRTIPTAVYDSFQR